MKRSEFIKKLMEPLKIVDVVDLWLFESEAEALLNRIEELGMLPPYNPIGSEPLEGHIMYCQWEPE